MSKTSVCGVQVSSWGTNEDAGNGMEHYFNYKLFGGNVGHVSVAVSFPADEKGKELIKRYCTDPPLPYEKHTIRVLAAKKDPSQASQYSAIEDAVIEEEVYVVNFSWWPKWSGIGYHLEAFENRDNLEERIGHSVKYSEKWKELLQPEKRYHKGKLGKTQMYYDFSTLRHDRNLTANQIALIDAESSAQRMQQQIESLNVLKNKMRKKFSVLDSLKIRKESLKDKPKKVNYYQENIGSLVKLKFLIKNNQDVTTLTKLEKERLNQVFPEWGEKSSIKEINKCVKKMKKERKFYAQDTYEKIVKDESTLSKITQTEVLLLDRYLPEWQQEYNINNLTQEAIKVLLPKIKEKIREINSEMSEINSEIRRLNKEALPEHVREFRAQYKNYLKLIDIKNYLISLKTNQRGNYLIDDDLERALELYEYIAEEPWKDNIVEAYPYADRYTFLDMDEMNNFIKKISDLVSSSLEEAEEIVSQDKDCQYYKYEKDYKSWFKIYSLLREWTDSRSTFYLKPDGVHELERPLQIMMDRVFSQIGKQWVGSSPDGFVKNRSEMTQKEAEDLFAFVKEKMSDAKKLLIEHQPGSGVFNQGDFSKFLTRGHPPDTVLNLPLDKSFNVANSHDYGMNVEAMLSEMQRITKNETFDLDTNNCSATVSKILAAGTRNELLKHQFQNRALGAVANPQMVVNNTKDYLEVLRTGPKDSWFKKVRRFSPIEQLGGWCFNMLFVEKNVPFRTKLTAGSLAAPIVLYQALKIAILSMNNPLQAYNKLISFAKYANDQKHVGFKIMAGMVYVPGLVVISPFSAFQFATKKTMGGIGAAINRIVGKKSTKKPEYAELTQDEYKQREATLHEFNNISKGVLNNTTVIEIKAKTPDEAINIFDNLEKNLGVAYAMRDFEEYDHKYPVVKLSKETEAMLLAEIKLLKTQDPEKAAKLEEKYQHYNDLNAYALGEIRNMITERIYIQNAQPTQGPSANDFKVVLEQLVSTQSTRRSLEISQTDNALLEPMPSEPASRKITANSLFKRFSELGRKKYKEQNEKKEEHLVKPRPRG